jgi:DNA-binding MarR family transcriptional regulator
MREKLKKEIRDIRQFNRCYTNVLGLLDRHILDSVFSLSEVRILYEIANMEFCTAKLLSAKLFLDQGYLSRILKSFQQQGLIEKQRSPKDGRVQYLKLSAAGQDRMHVLSAKSDKQIAEILNTLSDTKRTELTHCMKCIEEILEGAHHV